MDPRALATFRSPKPLVVLGAGGLGWSALPLVMRQLPCPAEDVVWIDAECGPRAREVAAELGVQLVRLTVTQANHREVLAAAVAPGGLLLDLAYNLDTVDLLSWCHENRVRYVNASVELWDPYSLPEDPAARTLYARHMRLRAEAAGWGVPGPTAVLDHGANPGLVSHFVKKALHDLASFWLADPAVPDDERRREVAAALADQDHARLAMHLGVRTIHISERDLQVTDVPKRPDEFVNTWSVEGLFEEATAPAELGWGTHEPALPPGAVTHPDGPRNQIALPSSGYRTLVRSWVPAGEIVGMLVRHGEAFSISEHLTVPGDAASAEPVYRPTVHYAYCLTDSAIASLHELTMRRGVLQPHHRVLHDEITDGADQFGVLLAGCDYGAWWYGCVLDIHEARQLQPRANATLLPVAAGVMAAVAWAYENPDAGVLLPDMLPWEAVLELALPFCGPMVSTPVDWCPERGVAAEQQCFPRDPSDYAIGKVLLDPAKETTSVSSGANPLKPTDA